MCPDPLQFLTWMAAHTEHIQLGSMVVVLPWHDPMHVAEQVYMLDNMSGGRLILGMGRGAGRIEFDGFGVPMNGICEGFVESAEMLLKGLEQGYCEYNGKFVRHHPQGEHWVGAPLQLFQGSHLCSRRVHRIIKNHG